MGTDISRGQIWSIAMALVGLVIAGLIGFLCYKEAEKFQRQYGQGPWGGSATLWGIAGFLLGLFGALLLVIAESNTKKQVRANNVVWSAPGYGSNQYPPPVAQPYGQAPVAPPYGQAPTAPPYGQPPAAQPAQWGPPPAQWGPPPGQPAAQPAAPAPGQWAPPPPPPPGPPGPPVEPRPNVGGSDFLPGRR